jgi:hypothetical protein
MASLEARRVGVSLTMCLITIFSCQALAQRDPLIGTWQLNVAKSKYTPGPPPKSQTLIYVSSGQTLTATTQGLDAQGKPTKVVLTIAYDEKDYPTVGSRDYDVSAYKRIDPFTTEFSRKRAGQIVQIGTRVLSKDGKTLTFTTKGVDVRGTHIENVTVYEKQ